MKIGVWEVNKVCYNSLGELSGVTFYCSNCKEESSLLYKYCPNCGSKNRKSKLFIDLCSSDDDR